VAIDGARRPNVLAGAAVDRAHLLRQDAEWLAARLEDPGTLVAPVAGTDVPVTAGDDPRAALLPPAALAGLVASEPGPVFLGLEDGRAVFAVDVSGAPEPELAAALAPARLAALREVGALVPQAEGGLLAYASGIVAWHGRHRFCGVCGSPTVSAEGGHMRACTNPECGARHFPRTDPVVIMLVTDGERCVLGRQAVWPPGRYSCLAGFVEPGESLEDAVAREVREEAGVEVDAVTYRSSQPWPFPSSLMLGFTAEYVGGDLVLGPDELEDVRWFTREELRAGTASGEVSLPPPVAIASRLIGDWLDG
jgi:NAD+ diphosphatase